MTGTSHRTNGSCVITGDTLAHSKQIKCSHKNDMHSLNRHTTTVGCRKKHTSNHTLCVSSWQWKGNKWNNKIDWKLKPFSSVDFDGEKIQLLRVAFFSKVKF